MLGRLFLRGLPGEFTEKSTYTWFALQTPESMKVFLGRLGTAFRYNFNRSSVSLATVTVREYDEVRQVLDSAQFRPSCVDKARRVVSGQGCVH
jgi:linoleate 10R-lipoxygenase